MDILEDHKLGRLALKALDYVTESDSNFLCKYSKKYLSSSLCLYSQRRHCLISVSRSHTSSPFPTVPQTLVRSATFPYIGTPMDYVREQVHCRKPCASYLQQLHGGWLTLSTSYTIEIVSHSSWSQYTIASAKKRCVPASVTPLMMLSHFYYIA
jgi:hypothetical protein